MIGVVVNQLSRAVMPIEFLHRDLGATENLIFGLRAERLQLVDPALRSQNLESAF